MNQMGRNIDWNIAGTTEHWRWNIGWNIARLSALIFDFPP